MTAETKSEYAMFTIVPTSGAAKLYTNNDTNAVGCELRADKSYTIPSKTVVRVSFGVGAVMCAVGDVRAAFSCYPAPCIATGPLSVRTTYHGYSDFGEIDVVDVYNNGDKDETIPAGAVVCHLVEAGLRPARQVVLPPDTKLESQARAPSLPRAKIEFQTYRHGAMLPAECAVMRDGRGVEVRMPREFTVPSLGVLDIHTGLRVRCTRDDKPAGFYMTRSNPLLDLRDGVTVFSETSTSPDGCHELVVRVRSRALEPVTVAAGGLIACLRTNWTGVFVLRGS